jgi:hypothetical protein
LHWFSADTNSDGLALAQKQQETENEMEGVESSLGNLQSTTGSLQTAFVALIAWVVIVTVALATLAFVTYRRWRRSATEYNMENTSSIDSASTADGSVVDFDSRGATNSGFDEEDMSPIEVSVERFEPAPVHEVSEVTSPSSQS